MTFQNINTKQLASIALLGAPFLGIGVYVEAYVPSLGNSWWTGIWGLLYITGWMAGVEVMRRYKLAGTDRFGRVIIWVMLGTLLIANLSNLWQAITPTYKPTVFWIIDTCWPLSHLLMLAMGVGVLRAGRIVGWQRWVPLAMGFWFPLTMAVSRTPIVLHFSNLYSVIVWTVFALLMLAEANRQQRAQIISGIAIRDDSPQTVRS